MQAGSTPGKRALLIGINQYPNLAERFQLHGCVNDVKLMQSILVDRFGFAADRVRLLADEQATRDGILAALDALADEAQPDEVVVLGYSGHGSQIRDREGDEPDGLDETIVPYDSGRDTFPNRDITDDEIYLRLLRLSQKTGNITLIFDCCHSGTISRDAFGEGSRWVDPDERGDDMLPPPASLPPDVLAGLGKTVESAAGWLPVANRYVLIAGCRDEQSSYEYEARQPQGERIPHGALTYFLGRELTSAQPGASYRDVFERASLQVTSVRPYQNPQMEGSINRELFGLRDFQPMRYVPVLQRSGNRVTLGAGAAHGMTAGSIWTVYPEGTREATGDDDAAGKVRIVQVLAATATAQIVSETSPGEIAAGGRAVEASHAYDEMRLVLQVVTPAEYEQDAAALKAEIERSPSLRLATDDKDADMRVYVLPPRSAVAAGDPVPQLPRIRRATWAVVGRDGRLAMPIHTLSEPDAIFVLVENFEKIGRYRAASALRNPNPNSILKDKIEFGLLRKAPDGSWEEATSSEVGGMVAFKQGDPIGFWIANNHTAPVYFSILDFGLTGAISPVHPVNAASEELAPERTLEFGTRPGEQIELYMPDNFPFGPDPVEESVTSGVEMFKVFATTQRSDFRSLMQGGTRGWEQEARPPNPLESLLELALTGQGTRDVRVISPAPADDWTTLECSFVLTC